LRDQRFFSLAELNQAVRPLLDKLNAQEFQKLEGSRNSWFEAQERPALLPLPAQPFELATWGKATVNIDYHAIVDYHGYSVPYHLVHQELETRSTATTVEFFHQSKRVAAQLHGLGQAPAAQGGGQMSSATQPAEFSASLCHRGHGALQ
jgi:hypothetical protein